MFVVLWTAVVAAIKETVCRSVMLLWGEKVLVKVSSEKAVNVTCVWALVCVYCDI